MAAPTTSEGRVTLALEAASMVGTWDGDLAAGVVYGDAQFARIYGVDPRIAAQGMPRGHYVEFIHPDDRAEARAEMDRLFAGAAEYVNEHRVIRPDGAERWVLARGRLIRDAAGAPVRFAGLSVDITERKRAETRQAFLLEFADRLRPLSLSRGIIDEAVAMLGRYLAVNRVGYGQVQPDDATILVETSYVEGIGPLTGAIPMAAFGAHNLLRHREGRTIVYEDVRAERLNDGTLLASGEARALISVPLIRDGQFRATLFASQREPRAWTAAEIALVEEVAARLWDAIERGRAEEALRQTAASLEAQVESRRRERDRTWRLAPVLMVVGDAAGRLLEVNPAWTRVLGWSAEATIGRDVMDFVAPEDRESSAAGMAQLFRGIPVIEFNTIFLTRAGERRRIAWNTVPEGGRLYGYGRDVTDQVLAEERLRQSQKMEAVGQLTGGLAHDFNNLLTGIAGALEMLHRRIARSSAGGSVALLAADAERYIGAAQGAARRGAALTHRLLAFSRQQTLDPRPTDINRLVAGMEALVRSSVGPALDIHVVAAKGLWTALVDAHQLENALLNLCINARDAMPDGGRLTIETANHELDAAAARAQELAPGPYLSLTVTDTGTGMTPEVMRRAFDPFFTTKPIGAGTGLGLSMIYGFARQSGGQVRIASEPGHGTSVRIYLPRHDGEAEDAATDHGAANCPLPAEGGSVLVVDDEPTVRLVVCEVLHDLGYAAIEAEDGAGALAVLRSSTRIDLLITDVGLPGGLNGRQLGDAARAIRPGLRVLLITGYAETAVVGQGHLEPGMWLLTKPFALDDLAARIRAITAETDVAG